MYYFKIISLKSCPYSEAAESLFRENNIKHELFKVDRAEKEKFKTADISTYPQIYLKKEHSNGSVLIGGFDTIKEYFDVVKNNTNNSKVLDKLKSKIKKDNNNISDKSILRLIELLI